MTATDSNRAAAKFVPCKGRGSKALRMLGGEGGGCGMAWDDDGEGGGAGMLGVEEAVRQCSSL